MNKEKVLEYINENLISKSGKLNQAAIRWGKLDKIKNDLIKLSKYKDIELLEILYLIYYNIDKPKCYCGNYNSFYGFSKKYSNYCSNSCAQSSPEIKNKKKKTIRTNYNVDNPSQSQVIKNKIKKTNLEKYGYESHNSSQKIKEKKKKSNLIKYGVENPMQLKHIKDKTRKTKLDKYGSKNYFAFGSIEYNNLIKEKYGVKNISQLNSIKNKKKFDNYYKNFKKLSKHNNCKLVTKFDNYDGYLQTYNWECLTCKTTFNAHYYACTCPTCYPKNKSKLEIEIVDYIKSIYYKDIIQNDRSIINPQELDIYLPDYNLAIEFNGIYWHSELNGKDKNYHLNKTLKCEKQGIRLLHIFEDEWVNKQDIVKARLKNILGKNDNRIGARKTVIKEINSKEKNNFLNKYHIQGGDKASIKLGAYYDNKLIGIMTFCKPRKSLGLKYKPGLWELSRFATISNTYTPGLASKLLSYFKKNYEWKEIYSYADRRWSQGNVYENIGFKFDHMTKPNYWYFNNLKLYHRFNYRKDVLNKKLNEFNANLTEWQNMQMNGWDRIWDCGNYKYTCKI